VPDECLHRNGYELLPPSRDALIMHLKRANYQTLVWLAAAQALLDLPGPYGHSWESKEDTLQIKWTDGFFMPQELVDIMIEETDETIADAEEPGFDDTDKYFVDEY
jgi:hypothetical protein